MYDYEIAQAILKLFLISQIIILIKISTTDYLSVKLGEDLDEI